MTALDLFATGRYAAHIADLHAAYYATRDAAHIARFRADYAETLRPDELRGKGCARGGRA